jgi:hypothetical protein
MDSEEKIRSYYIYLGSFSPCTISHVSSISSIIKHCNEKNKTPFTIIISPANKYYKKPSVLETNDVDTFTYLDEDSRFNILNESLEKKKQLANADDPFHTVEVIDESAEQTDNNNYVLVSRGEYRYGHDNKIALTSDVTAMNYNAIYGIPPQGDGKPDNVFLCLGVCNIEEDIFGWKDPNAIINNINILKIDSESRQTFLQGNKVEPVEAGQNGYDTYNKYKKERTDYENTKIPIRYKGTNNEDNKIISILNNRKKDDGTYYYKLTDNRVRENQNYDLDDFEIIDTIRKFGKVELDEDDSYSSTMVRNSLKKLEDSIYINVDTLVNYYVKSSSSSDGSTENGNEDNIGGKTREKPRYSRKKINLLKKNRKTKKKVKK